MHYNWPIIGDKIFGILKGSGFTLQMFDKTGKKIMDPHEATRFFSTIKSNDPKLDYFSILISIHDENSDSHIDIKTPNLSNDKDFNTIHTLNKSLKKNIGEKEGIKINWYKFDHVITAKDDAINNITENKDIGKVYGTTKSSFQKIGKSKLIVRHTDSVDESKHGSRWRKIKAIFIENALGERFHYPYPHVAGARAMARHLSNDGYMHDEIGNKIQQMSESYYDIKKSCKLLKQSELNEELTCAKNAIKFINARVKRLSGPRGYLKLVDDIEPKYNLSQVDVLFDKLVNTVNCNDDDHAALKTTAKYIVVMRDSDVKKIIISKLNELIPSVEDTKIQEKLVSIVNVLLNGLPIDIADIKFVINYIKGVEVSQENAPDLNRMRQLGGIF